MAKKNQVPAIEILNEVLGRRVVSYRPIYAKAFASVPAAIYLSQGCFWQFEAEHVEKKEICGVQYFDKTIAEWYEATGLSEEQQRSARQLLSSLGIILSRKAGVPAKLYYWIDIDALVAVLYRYKKTGKPVVVDNRRKQPLNTRTSSGKFRPLVTVINGDIIYEETNRDKRETKERVTAFASLAPNSLTHPPVSDVYTPVEEEEKAPQVPAPPPAAAPPDPGPYSSPKAKTPEALFDAVVEFYKNNPEMWRAGILEMGKGQRYSKEKQVETVRDWCCYMIQKNQGGNTYVQLNASLQSWFRNEQFATWKNKPVQAPAGSAAPTDAVYTPPPPNTITPAFVK